MKRPPLLTFCKHHQNSIILVVALVVVCWAIVVNAPGISIVNKREMLVHTSSGQRLNSFFQGLEPNPELAATILRIQSRSSCQKEPGKLVKLGRLLGLGPSVVYAQIDCSNGDHGCTQVCRSYASVDNCSYNCPSGVFYNIYPSGDPSVGALTDGLACEETPGCNCNYYTCTPCS